MQPLNPIFTSEQIDAARQLISSATRVVILTHLSPDGDAMGSSLAMRHFLEAQGKQVSVVVPNAFPDLTLSYPSSPSTCELVYRLITSLSPISNSPQGVQYPISDTQYPISDTRSPISQDIATCIYTGMMTDTGNFSFNSNYPEMYQIVGELVSFGVNKDEIYNRVFNAYSADRMRLMGYCLYQKMKIFPEHHTALIYLSRKELYRFNFQSGDAEGIVNLPLQIKDIHYSCFMREDKVNPTEVALAGGSKTKIKISLRSQGDRPVNVFAKDIFNGGGHANASGGEYYGPLPEAVQLFIDNYTQYFDK